MTDLNIDDLIAKMADDLTAITKPATAKIIGIRTGGLLVATQLAKVLNYNLPIGELNISFYRDDFTKIGLHPEVTPSNLPFSVDDETIILVDDVLHTGRTIRAALNEIFDYGRPKRVILVILVDRKDRELPFSPDICGQILTIKPTQEIRLLTKNNRLNLEVV